MPLSLDFGHFSFLKKVSEPPPFPFWRTPNFGSSPRFSPSPPPLFQCLTGHIPHHSPPFRFLMFRLSFDVSSFAVLNSLGSVWPGFHIFSFLAPVVLFFFPSIEPAAFPVTGKRKHFCVTSPVSLCLLPSPRAFQAFRISLIGAGTSPSADSIHMICQQSHQ